MQVSPQALLEGRRHILQHLSRKKEEGECRRCYLSIGFTYTARWESLSLAHTFSLSLSLSHTHTLSLSPFSTLPYAHIHTRTHYRVCSLPNLSTHPLLESGRFTASHAQPAFLWHCFSTEMHESPHAFPLRQVLQHPCDRCLGDGRSSLWEEDEDEARRL